jgi:hypothetical protein
MRSAKAVTEPTLKLSLDFILYTSASFPLSLIHCVEYHVTWCFDSHFVSIQKRDGAGQEREGKREKERESQHRVLIH